MNDNEAVARTRARGQRQLVLIFLAFLLPVLIAYGLYVGGWRSETTRNYGELVQPPRPVGDVALTQLDGKPLRLTDFNGKWLFVYFGPAACPPTCMDSLYKMRQVRLAQAKEAHRIERLFVLTTTEDVATLPARLADHGGMHVLHGAPAVIKSLAQTFALPAGSPLDEIGRIYVVDPLGNFMMSYPADADPNRMRKDMARLLRVSRVG